MSRRAALAGSRAGRAAKVAVASALLASCSPSAPTIPTPPPLPTPPAIVCPADVAALSPDGSPVVVSWPTPAVTGGTLPVSVACAPASGASFPLGSTAVACTATDLIGRTATCGFAVRVTRTPRLRASSFVAFGDSMTDGVISLHAPFFALVGSPVSYPARLAALLSARYSAQTIVVFNAGVNGETTSLGALRLPDVLSADHPDVVLLLEGANDINAGTDNVAGTVADNMADMIRVARSKGAAVYLATLPPQREGGYRVTAPWLVPEVNARLARLAADTGVVLVDIYAAFGGVPGNLIGPDGLHPNEAGYAVIAETFFDSIVKTLEAPAVPTAAARRR